MDKTQGRFLSNNMLANVNANKIFAIGDGCLPDAEEAGGYGVFACSELSAANMQRLWEMRDVPCFIVAPRGFGKSSFARLYADRYFDAASVCWVDAATAGCDELIHALTNAAAQAGALPEGQGRLLVVDGLGYLEGDAASDLSDAIDAAVEAGWQAVVTTTPQCDCYGRLQSDRHMIDGRRIMAMRSFTEAQRADSLRAFLCDGLPEEIRTFALLATLLGSLSIAQASSLGMSVHDDLPGYIAELHPFYTYDAESACLRVLPVAPAELGMAALTGEPLGEAAASGLACAEAGADAKAAAQARSEAWETGPSCEKSCIDDILPTDVFVREAQKPVLAHPRQSATDGVEHLHIKLLGGLKVFRGNTLVEHSALRASRARQLLTHLAMAHGHGIPRDAIVKRFWPMRNGKRGNDNLYVLCTRLGKALAGDGERSDSYLIREAGVVRLNERHVSVDVDAFERQARLMLLGNLTVPERVALAEELEALYEGGMVMDKYSDPHIRSYSSRLASLIVEVLLTASSLYEAEGNRASAMWMVRRACDADATKEEVYRALMGAQIKAGMRTSAMQTYFACKDYLSEELGIMPSHQTTSLYQDLLMDSI